MEDVSDDESRRAWLCGLIRRHPTLRKCCDGSDEAAARAAAEALAAAEAEGLTLFKSETSSGYRAVQKNGDEKGYRAVVRKDGEKKTLGTYNTAEEGALAVARHFKVVYPDGPPLQAFTAIGQITDDEPYQAEVSPDFTPWRRKVDFLDCVETPIRPLLERLDFIEDKSRWGFKFRFGVFRIGDHDLDVLRSAMLAPSGEATVDT